MCEMKVGQNIANLVGGKNTLADHGPGISVSAETKPYDLISQTQAWKDLWRHAKEDISQTHLRQLLSDAKRDASLTVEWDGIFVDFSRQRVQLKTMDMLFDLALSSTLGS